jgi:hypothetical protein
MLGIRRTPRDGNCNVRWSIWSTAIAVKSHKVQAPRCLITATVASLLASCTHAQIEVVQIGNTAREVQTKVLACRSKIDANPQYAFIYRKLGVATSQDPAREPAQTQLADNEKVSDDAVALGLNWYAEAQTCDVEMIESLSGVAPELRPVFISSQREITDIINEIVATRPTYGHVNQRILDLKRHQKEALNQAVQQIKARLAAEHAQELEDRQVVAEQLAQLALDVATTLATRQVNLIRTQRAFAAAYPHYQLQRIRVVKCNPVARASDAAIATIKGRYAALGLSGSTMEAQAIADAQSRSVAISCQLV